jgi:hypothetical protein
MTPQYHYKSLLYPEYGGSVHLRNTGTHLPDYVVS